MSDPTPKPRRLLTKETMGITAGLPLQASEGGLEELRSDIQRLMDLEAIKQLKHAYFRCLDTANWAEIATLFHPDVQVHFSGGSYEWTLQGRDEYVKAVSSSFTRKSIGHHNGHQPEIQLLSESEATGLWYLADHMWILEAKFLTQGTAIYWDRYVKQDGRWLIRETSYERIYEIHSEQSPQLAAHYLRDHATASG